MKRQGFVVMTLILAMALQGCRRSPERKTAEQLSKLATTRDQARLWQQAADQGLTAGLAKLEQTDRPVQSRQPSTVDNLTIPPAAQNPAIPAGVVGTIRIISSTGLENADYNGSATVADVSGERLSLDLGERRTLVFQARADGGPLGVMKGDMVRVECRFRNERINRRQILAVRAPNGRGIARITETGSSALSVTVSLFGLVAKQAMGQSPTSVDVRVGGARKVMVPGEIAQIGGLTVGLLTSSAITGPEAQTLEGSPYSIDLIAWSSR
jgi:hypothetical protein